MSKIGGSIGYVFKNEGGFTDDPNDSGGATNWGITHDDLARFLCRSVSVDDVKNISQGLATQIYEEFYWDPMDLCDVDDQNVATCIFDTGVNRGISRAVKYAQQVVGTSQDGRMGPITLKAINEMPRARFISDYWKLVFDGYLEIVKNNPSQNVFLNGWKNRANRLLTLI